MQPAPPSPPLTKMSISSTNISVPVGRGRPPASSGRAGDDAHVAVVAAPLEPHVAVDLCKEGVVRAEADVEAGPKGRAALPDEEPAARDELAAEPLDAEHLRIRVAAVARAADTLLVSHDLDLDLRDAHGGRRLPVAAVTPVVLAPLELHDPDLAGASLPHHLARHARLREAVGARDDLTVLVDEQHRGELHRRPLVARQPVDGALEHPAQLAGERALVHALGPVGHRLEVAAVAVEGGQDVVERDLARLAASRAQLLVGGVGGDAVQPAAEGRLALEGADLARGRPEGVLSGLLGVFLHTGDPLPEPVHAVTEPLDEPLGGLRVLAAQRLDEVGVDVGAGAGRDGHAGTSYAAR